jgi:hypothetical protein
MWFEGGRIRFGRNRVVDIVINRELAIGIKQAMRRTGLIQFDVQTSLLRRVGP